MFLFFNTFDVSMSSVLLFGSIGFIDVVVGCLCVTLKELTEIKYVPT